MRKSYNDNIHSFSHITELWQMLGIPHLHQTDQLNHPEAGNPCQNKKNESNLWKKSNLNNIFYPSNFENYNQ